MSSRKRKLSDEVENDENEDDCFSDEEGTRVDGIYIPPPTKPTLSFDPTGPRLIITKIVNNYFKSYAEEQVLGPFHKCFNAIVGPNGSGKSNVIDSMLFVFGYRANKIRCKKVSVLLHNSENHRNVQSGTVAVHFAEIIDRDGDNYDIVPGSEFVVSRTANKDNSSFYTLNRKKVQFKEVGVLLKKHGIDLDHNRFLILQGEVEQIAMMKCKAENEHESGMLEYLEDIIGTSRYKKPLVQLHERVELLNEQRTEKLNRLRIVEKEVEELRGPMEEAVGFLKTENTISNCKNFIYQKNIKDLESKVVSSKEEYDEIKEAQTKLEDKLTEITKKKQENDEVLKKESSKYESMQKRKEGIKEAYDKANKKDIQLQESMTQMNNNRKKTKELLAGEHKNLQKLLKQPEKNIKDIEECEIKEAELTEKKERYEDDKTKLLASLQTETKVLQEKKEEIQTDLVELKKAVDETRSAFSLAESELKIYVSNEVNERTKFEELTKLFVTNNETVEERTEAVKLLKTKIPATEKSLKETNDELNKVKLQESMIINEVRSKRHFLEEKKSSMNASRSRGRVLDSLMQQKREGKCKGLFGRLGDLGAIDQKFDVAISTACGPLDNIVVDTVSTAQWCIEFLKRHDIGRATFIALEKQEHLAQHANSQIRTPENVPRLFDLIKIQDDRVRTAFYYALRDTLVANDLDQASRIAYGAQRFRVVTLGGDLIETTGTMSGGGKQVSRGRMGQSVAVTNVDPKELENLEAELSEMEQKVRQLRERQSQLESQVNVLEPELRKMKIDYEKFSMELKALEQQQPSIAKQLKEQEVKAKQTKADPVQVKKLTLVVENKKAAFDQASEAANELQVEVDKLTKEIKAKTTGKMSAIEKNIKEAKTGIDKCKAEITRLRVASKTAERNAEKSKEKIATMEQDITDMENKLRAMRDERLEIESDAAKLLQCVEEITQKLEDAEEAYSDVKNTVAELTKKENAIKSDKVDIDQKVKAANTKLNDYKATIHQWEVKLTHLKLQDIPNETMESLKKFTSEELEERSVEDVQKELDAADHFLKTAKPNLNAIQEYRKKQSVFVERSKDLEQVTEKKNQMRKLYDDIRVQRKDEFLVGYNIIKLKLKEMYQMITLGGDADFEMVDTFDPFTEGIQFNVRPPKKSWKKISNLSGGEKTLSSLALVFALHYYKPSPLYVMDEIDAALDFKNVSIVGHYIKERTKNAQFIIISLRSNMFELCDNLIGIYKTYNCTKTITIDPRIYDNNQKNQDQVVPDTQQEPKVDAPLPSQASQVAEKSSSEDIIGPTTSESTNIQSTESESELSDRILEESFRAEPMEVD
ncbi:unnamed protein product [Brassicogethes aeneus]|uniref:Structural maintenance of chromosomes protein n=1 Tax=Brassicogethes aeneus TaxID=1431903 RepID=A0A9P0F991_BRAAE|nr:unnamed protein product [Brassicogethes aeneus]